MAVTVLKPITVVEDLSVWQCPSCESRYTSPKEDDEQCPECDSYQNYQPVLIIDLAEFFSGRRNTEFRARIIWVCTECECKFDEPYAKCPQGDCDSEEPPIPKIVAINPDDVTYIPKPAYSSVPQDLPVSRPQPRSGMGVILIMLLIIVVMFTVFVALGEGWINMDKIQSLFY